jgi:Zn-dependent alcohol dehydrogenase
MVMGAWQVHEHGSPGQVLRLVESAVPQRGPGELRARVEAAAIGMPDVFMFRGAYRLRPAVPVVPGKEVCRIVDAVGDGVDVAVGTRVMGVTSFFTGRGGSPTSQSCISRPSTASLSRCSRMWQHGCAWGRTSSQSQRGRRSWHSPASGRFLVVGFASGQWLHVSVDEISR